MNSVVDDIVVVAEQQLGSAQSALDLLTSVCEERLPEGEGLESIFGDVFPRLLI